jgi:hypothetical protein
MDKVSEDKFKLFEPLTQRGITQGATADHWVLLLGLVDEHAKITKDIDPVDMHIRLNDEYNNLIMSWFLASSLGDNLRSMNKKMDMQSFAMMIEQEYVYTLDDLLLLLNMWKEVMLRNEVFEMISSIDLGIEYVQHLKGIKREQKQKEVRKIQEIVQDEERINIFDPLLHVGNGAAYDDWTKLFMLIEIDAVRRTGNEEAFRHDEIGHQVYPQILLHWYEQSSVRQKFDAEEMIRGKLDIVTMDRILRAHRFSLEDLDLLLDIMTVAMDENDMQHNIPSIDLAREFLLRLRLKRDLEKIDPKGQVSYEWDKLG